MSNSMNYNFGYSSIKAYNFVRIKPIAESDE